MGFDNVNVNVSGPVQPTSIYKTKVLKGNHSFASQVTEPNMKYVVKHDFVLDGDVTIPTNCVLDFDGGSISGAYTITGNNTVINAGLTKIFGFDVTFAGSWKYAEAYPEWFGAKGDGTTIDTVSLQKTIDIFDNIKFNKTYITRPLHIGSNKLLVFLPESKLYSTNDYSDYDVVPTPKPEGWTPDCILELTNSKNVTIEGNGAELSMLDYYHNADAESRHCIRLNSCENITINNLRCNKSGGDGICLANPTNVIPNTEIIQHNENIIITGCIIDGNKRQGISIIDGVNVTIDSCKLLNTFSQAPGAGIDIESNNTDEEIYAIKNINILNCYSNNNNDGIRITPQHYSTPMSVNILNHVSENDISGLSVVQVGDAGGVHEKIYGSINIDGYTILSPKCSAISFDNMYITNCHLHIQNVYIKNVGSSGSTINRERSAILHRDEREIIATGSYSGNYSIKNVVIDDDRPTPNLFAPIYMEITTFDEAPLKDITIENVVVNCEWLNEEPIVFTGLNDAVDSVLVDIIAPNYRDGSATINMKTNRGYQPIGINRNNIYITTTLLHKQKFIFKDISEVGHLNFDISHPLKYNNLNITKVSCVEGGLNSEICITYNGTFWEIESIYGLWDFNVNYKGPTNYRPNGDNIEIGFNYFDQTLGYPIWYKGKDGSDNDVWVDATGATV